MRNVPKARETYRWHNNPSLVQRFSVTGGDCFMSLKRQRRAVKLHLWPGLCKMNLSL
jgi:hypothetical protein